MAAAACHRSESAGPSGHGTVEVTETDVAPTASARVVAIRVDDGDVVRKGDTVAVLTQASLAPNLAREQARLARAEAALRDLRQGARPAEIARAEAEVAATAAEAARTARDLERMRSLAERNVVSRQQLDGAEAAAKLTAARNASAVEALQLTREGTRPDQVRAAGAEVASARAAVGAVEAERGDLVLIAPRDGVVLGRYAEPGEVVAPGTPVLTLGQTERPYVRVYLAARDLANVRVGQRATISLDGVPDRHFDGGVVAINPRAEFTPRVALSEEERADLLFGVKVAIHDTTGAVKPGMPATVRLARAP